MVHDQTTSSGPLASDPEQQNPIPDNSYPKDAKDARHTIDSTDSDDSPSDNVQAGVKQAEAITLTWTKKSLAIAYILMWFLYFINGFNQTLDGSLSAYVTSDFESHSLIPLISVVSSVMSAATYMPLAKVLNLWDRSVGFAAMAILATIGLILTAVCDNIATYCAARVFYSIGYAGMTFAIDVITADTSSLRDRGLAYAFTSSPYIITAYAGPAAAEKFYADNWRWAYGSFAIILPFFAVPMVGILRYAKSQAKKQGLLPPKVASGRTLMQSIWHYAIEFDILGTFLLAAGLVVFLLPFNINGEYGDGWGSDGIIAMLVIGAVLIIAFGLNEKFLAPVPFLDWKIVRSRTVLGTCALDVCYQISYSCWAYYYTSFLQVNCGVSISVAGYVNNIFDVVSGLWLFGVGLLIKKTCRYRWLLYWIIPLYMLGIGLMIHFRKPDQSIGYLIMCQIFMAFSGGALIIVMQTSVLAASDHQNAAGALAFLNVFGSIGGAIGGSVSAAIWTGTFPGALQRYLPADALGDWENIYADIEVQKSYAKGSAARYAIEKAYALAQGDMVIAGTAIMALSLVWMFVIKDIKLDRNQTKGVLF